MTVEFIVYRLSILYTVLIEIQLSIQSHSGECQIFQITKCG